MKSPMISVIIPAYNMSAYLEEAVRSVQGQTYADIEIIIVDDASTDDTGTLAERLAKQDPRIRVLHHETNKYRAGALNTGIAHARGIYISLLDADDVYVPDKLEKQLVYMQDHPEIAMVYGDFIVWQHDGSDEHADGSTVESVTLPQHPRDILMEAAKDPYLEKRKPYQILGQHDQDKIIPSCSPLIRKEVFDTVRYDEELRASQDYDMWFQIIGQGYAIARLPMPTYKYRYHEGQISKNATAVEQAQMRIIEKVRSGAYLVSGRAA